MVQGDGGIRGLKEFRILSLILLERTSRRATRLYSATYCLLFIIIIVILSIDIIITITTS